MEQKVTIYTLAEKLNMSVSAVSRAFNPNSKLSAEKRKIILEAAEQYGYVQNKMASRLSQQPIRIGVLMRGRIEAYYLKMLDGIKAAYADFQNYKVTCDIRTLSRDDFSADNACAVLEEFRSAGYDGVILHGIYHEGIVAKVNELAEAGIKVVTLHKLPPVHIDDEHRVHRAHGRPAVRYLPAAGPAEYHCILRQHAVAHPPGADLLVFPLRDDAGAAAAAAL